jgi:OOP family OmpA-OmpF porin
MSTRQRLAVALLAALCSGAAHAQDKRFYAGAGAGAAADNDPGNCADAFDTNFPYSCSSKDSDVGWKIFAGYRVDEFLALEAGYVDLGKFKTSGTGVFLGLAGTTIDATFHPTGFSFDAVGTLPVGNGFGLLGRIGVFRWTLYAPFTTSGGFGTSSRAKPSGYNLDFGVGGKFDFTENMGARIEFQQFRRIGDNDTGKTDVNLISGSVIYRFN